MHNRVVELHDLRARLDATTARLDMATAQLAATQQRLLAAEQTLARVQQPHQRRRTGRARFGAAVALALLVALVPLSLVAAGPFTDLVPTSPHNTDIATIYNAGITKGCVPNVSYCPTANVTRQEMASFLARTAGLGGNPPVANALTAVNAQNAAHAGSADTAASAANAQNAATVAGYAPNALVRVARGSGYPDTGARLTTTAYTPIASATIAVPGPGFVLVTGAVSPADYSTSQRAIVLARLRDTAPGGEASPTQHANGGNFSVATSWVFPVSAAGTKTYVVEASLAVAGNGDTIASDGQITALYIPFGSEGGSALGGE